MAITAPSNLSIEKSEVYPGENDVLLTWTNPQEDIDGLHIDITRNSSGEFLRRYSSDPTSGFYYIDIPESATVGEYLKISVNAYNTGTDEAGPAASILVKVAAPESGTPPAPASITVSDYVKGQPITISWSPVTFSEVFTYVLECCTNESGHWGTIYDGTETSYVLSTLRENVNSVQFRVMTARINGVAVSEYTVSEVKTAGTVTPPEPPTPSAVSGRLEQFQNGDGTNIYPRTIMEGVFRESDGKSLGDVLEEIETTPGPQGPAGVDGKDGKDGKLPIKVNILQTICEDVSLTDSSTSYTLPSQIVLDSSILYFLKYKYYFEDGSLDSRNSGNVFSKLESTDSGSFVRWLSSAENNSVTLTTTSVMDTWRSSGHQSVVSIYSVEIVVENEINLVSLNKEGIQTVASGKSSHAEGLQTVASGNNSHAEGSQTVASGSNSHAEGIQTVASGNNSHAEGYAGIASGSASHVEGGKITGKEQNKASGYSAHAEGASTEASGAQSHAEGSQTVASGNNSHAEGLQTVASGSSSHAGGFGTIASAYAQVAFGRYNVEYPGMNGTTPDADFTNISALLLLGKGNSTARANAFRIAQTGVYASGDFNSTGADYAEMFEWLDGNPDKQDRRGLFVTLDGDKIRLASPEDDFILGIVSGNPSVVGDVHDDQWQGMYLYDIFGRPVWEDVEVSEERDENGNIIRNAGTERRQKLNPDYDSNQPYQPRSERPEWDAVGMLGKLVTVDDGSCDVNGWCMVGENGIAVRSETRMKYRVMARLDDTHIRVLIL